MSNASPIVALRKWLESQPEEARHELALNVAYPMFDVPSLTLANKKECIQLVLDWLDDTIARNLQLGRILSFRACMDYLMSGRDTPAKWDELDERTKQIVGDLPPENAATGDFLLTVMPARREQWIQLAADWYRLRDGIFEGRHLDAWAFQG